MVFVKLIVLSTLLGFTTANPGPAVTEAPIPRLHKRQLAACNSFLGIESSCEAATPSFTDLALTSQVSCLCNPASVFDVAFNSCLRYLSTAETDLFNSFSNLPSSPCATFNGPASTSASATRTGSSSSSSSTSSNTRTGTSSSSSSTITSPANTNDANYRACTSASQLVSSCAQATNGFSDIPFTRKASCLCYSSSSYIPQRYDEDIKSCYSYFQTANPPIYQSFIRSGGVVTPCASVGNIVAGASVGGSTTTRPGGSSSTTTTSTTSTGNIAPTGVIGSGAAPMAAAVGALALAVFL